MKLADVRDTYYGATSKASEVCRQLALGAIAIIWIFRGGQGLEIILPEKLLIALILVAISLTLDLTQYAATSAIWGIYNSSLEKQGTSLTEEFQAPNYINWPALFFFWTKIASLAGSYIFLLMHIAKNISKI